jgi:hypothetical protein
MILEMNHADTKVPLSLGRCLLTESANTQTNKREAIPPKKISTIIFFCFKS